MSPRPACGLRWPARDLVDELTYEAELGEALMIPNGPYGTRVVVPATGGKATGKRIKGRLVGGGGDSFDGQYFRSTPRMETGVEYEVFRVD